MTQEEKQLLLQDICGRLPYGVITKNCRNNFDIPAHLLPYVIGIKLLIDEYDLKPYLRPMSSMTEEEKEELFSIIYKENEMICEQMRTGNCGIKEGKYHFNTCLEFDWLNTHHFDYRTIKDKDGKEKTMIELGLALEAPEGMYNIKTE